jgi:transposase
MAGIAFTSDCDHRVWLFQNVTRFRLKRKARDYQRIKRIGSFRFIHGPSAVRVIRRFFSCRIRGKKVSR